uniref:ZM domain-containing protein n=1 Tax=Haemonchus contortus TaxID=6289 RepID=A0A912MPM1_HAECO
MGEVLVGGVWVPSAIAQHFKDEGHAPFSYTKPNLKFQPREVKLNIKTFQPHREQIFVEDYKRRLLKIAISKLDDDRGHRRRPLRRYSDVQQVATRPAAFFYPDRRGHMYKPLRRYNSELESLSTRPTTFIVPESGMRGPTHRPVRRYSEVQQVVARPSAIVIPDPHLVTKGGMAQPVHLQYNSPMPIYSKEAAEEQYQQQIGATTPPPIPLPAADKHFDPAKSATLKFIREGDEGHFGEHFFEQIANVEAPRIIGKEEPEWARYAREKSERARSRTPADPSQHRHTASTTPIDHRYERSRGGDSPREFMEKSKVYTHTTHPTYGPAYYQTQSHARRRGYSEPRETHPGYEYGGLDYTKGLNFPAAPFDHSYEYRSRARDRDQYRPRSGYELGGLAFGKGQVAPGPYHGHGPDPPRLRPRYSADPRSPCNSYYAPNLEEVDANLLVGDTISNQKIRHETRHIDQSQFGTSFAPPTGFKRDHITVKRSPVPPEPITFSVSANKNRYGSTGNVAMEREQMWRRQVQQQRQYPTSPVGDKEVTVKTLLNDDVLRKVDRETTPVWRDRSLSKHEAWRYRSDPRLDRHQVFTNEPNWSRTVQQRRNAWERMAYDTDARVSLPASAKVPAPQPPAWHNRAARTHNIWQQAADTMSQGATDTYQQPGQTYESSHTSVQHSDGSHQYQSQHYHEERHSQYSSEGHQEQQRREEQYRHEEQQRREEQHRREEQRRHEEQQYTTSSAPVIQSYSTTHHSESHTESAPAPQSYIVSSGATNADLQVNSGYNANQIDYVKDHIDKYQGGPIYGGSSQYEEISKSSYNKTYSSSTQQQNVAQQGEAIPLPAPTQSYTYSSETRTSSQAIPAAAPAPSSNYQQQSNYSHHSSHTTETSKAIPIQPEKSNYEESSYHRTESSKQETSRGVPMQSNQDSFNKSYIVQSSTTPISVQTPQNYSTSYHTETHTTQNPIVMHSPGGSYKSYQSSHYSKQEKTTSTTTTQPQPMITHTTNLPITKSTTYNYSQSTTGSAPQPAPASQSSYQAHMSRHKEETHREETSRPVSQLSQFSEQKSFKRNVEEKTETKTIPGTTTVYTSDGNRNFSVQDVFNKREEMNETLPLGSISNTHANTQGGYRDQQGHDVSYKRETQTAVDPGKEYALLKEEEKRVVETDLEPGVISRHVTTKYYKKKTVTDTTTTTTPQ